MKSCVRVPSELSRSRMHTFYVPPSQIRAGTATITNSERHHLRNVLRLAQGETIRIIDGQGAVYTAEILDLGTHLTSVARILSHEFHARVPPSFTLFQGIPKDDKMVLILQKTTEIGVTQVIPMRSAYSLQKPSPSRYDRWQRVVVSATKQCKRAWLPEVCAPQTFEASLAQLEKFSLCLFLSPSLGHGSPTPSLKTVLREASEVTAVALFVGPEGGFSHREVTAAIAGGCIPVTLGPNTLRTETAAIVAVAAAAYEYQL